MKFTDVRTLKHVLKEYGLQPGAPTPVGQQTTGAVAKATAAPTKAPKQDLGSPSVTQGLDIPKIGEPETGVDAPQPTLMKAKDFEDGAEYLDDKGEVAGKVVSKVGKGPAIKKLIVQNPKGEYTLIDPDEELTVAPITEAKAGKYSKQVHKNALRKASKSKNSISSVKQKIKKLARKVQMQEQGAEQLFELNFNTREVIESALDSPIKCGFEAETVWEGLSSGGSGYDVDDMDWSEIEDRIGDEYGRSYLDDIAEAYRNWIMEEKMYEYESDLIQDLVNERKEDEAYIEEFIDSNGGPTEGAIEQYKDDFKLNNPEEYENRIEDGYEYINWLREYVEENMEDELIEWLEQDIRDNGEVFDAALEAAEDNLDYSDWLNDQYNGYWSRMLEEYDIYLDASGGGLEEVGDELRGWASNNSQSDHIEVGEYHSGGINNDYWRVEDDSSIEGDGAGAEIISPVYQTPRAMLEEIKSLFEDLSKRSVETNRSTGLHVTMSLDPTQTDMSASAQVNKVKLAVLLGDKYLASTFGRENNSYAKSQYERLEKRAVELKADPTNTKTIEAIEQILESAISSDKFSSINFKNQSDNRSGYNLIEFRIAGGHDYHTDMPKIVKSVVRYAETLRAAYTDEHRGDYVKALFKLINNVGKISTDLEDRVKGRYEELDHPVVDVLKGFFGKDHYMESVGTLARAFKNLNDYKENMEPDADAKWEQRVAQWEKQTGETHERLKEAPTPREAVVGIMKPQKRPPSVNAPKFLSEAQNMFSAAVAQAGYDLNQNLNREQVNAKAIGVLRKTLPEFELTYETLSDKVNRNYKQIEFGRGSADEEAKFSRVKNGVDRLFKKDIIVAPEFLSELQLEKIISGIWNAMNSEEGNSSNDKALVAAVVNASSNTVDSDVERVLGYTGSEKPQDYVALKRLISGGRGDWFTVGNTIQGNDYDTLIRELKKYPAWEHPVAREHDARTTGRETDYASASARKMLDKLQSRMNALSNLRNTDPELYINSLKQMFNSSKQLLKQVKKTTAGDTYTFSMTDREHDRIVEIISSIEAQNYVPDPFSDQPAIAVFSHIKSWLEDQLTTHSYGKELDPGDTKAKYKARTNAVAKWLGTLDTISQKLGFDSQKGAIDNKLNQVQKGRDLQIATHGEYKASITVFNYGGDVWATNSLNAIINNTDNMDDWSVQYLQDFYSSFNFNSSMFRSADSRLLIIPHAHYFIALEASEHKADGSFRDSKAEDILRKFRNVYGISIQDLASEYTKVHLRKLKQMGVQVIEKGDGREGLPPYNFAPLLPRVEINAPNGEPFEKSSAAAWLVNNPEKANQPAPTGDMDDYFAKARDFYPAFDEMMRDGMQNYMRSGKPVNDLVSFLNNGGNTSAMKAAVLQAIHKNRGLYGSPLTFDQALQLGVNRMGNNESVFTKFDKLTLEEQINIINKVSKDKIDRLYENKEDLPSGYHKWKVSYKDGRTEEVIAQSTYGVRRKLGNGKDVSKKELGVKSIKKIPQIGRKPKGSFGFNNKGFTKDKRDLKKIKDKEFEKDPGSYVHDRNMSHANIEESVPDLNKIKILNKILADHFPVSDLKKQMLAYEAIPIPQMLTDFRGLRAGSGDDACARGIVRHYIQALTKEEQKQIDLQEWSKHHVKKLLLTESDDKSDAKQLVQKSSTLSVIATVVNFLRGVVSRQEIDAYTTPAQPEPDAQQDTEQQQEGKQQLVKEDLDQLKQEAFSLIGEVEDVAELNKVVAFLKKNEITELATAAIIANISQGVKGDLDQKIANLVMNTPGDFASKEKFLKDLGTGNGLWSGNVLITNLTGNIYDMLSSNPIASALAKPIALQLRGAMGYGPDQGPGEFLLALTGGGIDLAEKSDLVLIDGKGVEVKADGTSVGKSGKKSRSGGRLYSTGGYNGGSGARQVVKQAFMDLGITEDELEQYGWNGKIKGLTYFNLNFNLAGIKNMNKVLKKTPAGSAQKILYAIAKGFYIDVPENTDAFNNMINSYSGNEIDPIEAIFNFVALGHDYYKLKEGHDYIMIFNTATGGYVMIKDASDMKQLLDSGHVKLNGGMDFFDDRSKGTPQILTGNI